MSGDEAGGASGAPALQPGLTGEYSLTVGTAETAARAGNDAALTVLSTPHLLLVLEMACHAAVRPALAAGQGVVGSAMTVRHLAPTPLGERVTARATLREVDGARLVFDAVADDEHERIGEGRLETYVIDLARFARRIARKAEGG